MLHELYGTHYRDLLEAIVQADPDRYPVLAEIRDLFETKAREIQQGGPEYIPAEKWMAIWWSADQFALIKLIADNKLNELYLQCEQALYETMQALGTSLDPILLHEAIELNQSLLIRPFCMSNETLGLTYNIWEFYQSVMQGTPIALEKKLCQHRVLRTRPIWLTWNDWFEYLIFCYHNRDHYWYRTRLTSL